jgi:PLP dependent protein
MTGAARALEEVRAEVRAACERRSRNPGAIAIVAVSKGFPASRVREVLESGHVLFGENRVQEALSKMAEVGPGARWHLVGHLQRNKARRAAGAFELIHSVEDLGLARELGRRATAAGIVQPILVQVNLSREATKSGVAEEDLGGFLEGVLGQPGLDLRGLMTLPPPPAEPEDSRRYFARLREIRDETAARLSRPLPELSMGMTDDFAVAVEEGATLIRIGRAIFGERPDPNDYDSGEES